MILTRMEQLSGYESLVPGIQSALTCALEQRQAAPGRYELENGFFMIQKGMTNPVETVRFETHRRFVDVQILLEGSELLVWERADQLIVSDPYDETKDLELYTGNGSAIQILPGMSYIVFPEDAHKACCHEDSPSEYLKLVLKLDYERK
ncbi:MAG: YhcH/YjgK/YiaL family protein [Clostridiales bacterium]|nr:YhcH/YjgK/YiaL family protein [Clostridiales bacterium]